MKQEMKQEMWHGDCLELMKNIPDNSIDLILCDPPYGTTAIDWDTCLDFAELWRIYDRILTERGTVILFGNGMFTANLICSKSDWYKYSLIWKKSKCGSPFLAKYRPMMKHEDIVVFVKEGKSHRAFNPIMEEGTPYHRENIKYKLNNHKYGIKQISVVNHGTRYPGSILEFPQQWRRQDQVHPTQKPIELMEYLITTYSNENDLVLDNCAGSGPVLVAAKHLNRQFIGIEKEKEYYDICVSKLM